MICLLIPHDAVPDRLVARLVAIVVVVIGLVVAAALLGKDGSYLS